MRFNDKYREFGDKKYIWDKAKCATLLQATDKFLILSATVRQNDRFVTVHTQMQAKQQ